MKTKLQQGSVYQKIVFLPKQEGFSSFHVFLKNGKQKKISGQSLTNICDFFIFYHSSTSEMELDYYHQKLNVRVVSRTAIRFKTYDLRKLYKNLEIELWHNLMPSLCTKK